MRGIQVADGIQTGPYNGDNVDEDVGARVSLRRGEWTREDGMCGMEACGMTSAGAGGKGGFKR